MDYYEIAVREFRQHVLPASMGLEPTTVWSYGSVNDPDAFNYPAFTIEAAWRQPVRVKWINGLVTANGDYLPHLLPIDQTLHWANPPGGVRGRDRHGTDASQYRGPVPIVTHLHGGHSTEESDGYPEAWYLPAAHNIPAGYARRARCTTVSAPSEAGAGPAWTPGTAVFQYPNDQPRRHDLVPRPHARDDACERVRRTGGLLLAARRAGGPRRRAVLPEPAPRPATPRGRLFRDPDRYPGPFLQRRRLAVLPRQPGVLRGSGCQSAADAVHPDTACGGPSDVAPDLEPRVLRRRDRRQRRDVAVSWRWSRGVIVSAS